MLSSRLISAATAVALSSEGTGRNHNFRVGAILFDRKGRILAARPNSYKTHPFLTRYTNYPHLHAECGVILNAGLQHCNHSSLLVVRVLRNGKLSMARPCPMCSSLIHMAQIKNTYYSDWNGKICQETFG